MAVYQAEYEIHTYDADSTGVATASALFRFLLDAASVHADAVGYGYRHMKEQAYAWVLSRFRFRVDRLPQWQERIAVETWPSGSERLFALRDYRITDQSGSTIGRATSSWIVIDAEKRTPERLERLPLARSFTTDEHVFDRNAAKVGTASEPRHARSDEATYSDIDLNGHVTSSRYLDWMLDALSGEFQTSHQLSEFEINYLVETLCGEGVRVLIAEEGGSGEIVPTVAAQPASPGPMLPLRSFLHSVERSSDGTPLCRARTVWSPRATRRGGERGQQDRRGAHRADT